MKHNFLSVPVLQKTKHKWYGFIEVGDIVGFYVEHFGDALGDEGKKFWDTIAEKEGFMDITVGEVMKHPLTRANPFHPIMNGYSLYYAIETLAREEALHRVPIIDANRNLKSVLTQSQVIEFLYDNYDKLGLITNKPVGEMEGVLRDVHTIHEESRAIDGFKMMQKQNVSAVAVVDNDGKVVGNLSLRDLKAIRLENQLFARLFQTTQHFLRRLREEFPSARPKTKQVVTVDDTLGHVIKVLVDHSIHRVYIVNSDQKPIGVISLRNVLMDIITN